MGETSEDFSGRSCTSWCCLSAEKVHFLGLSISRESTLPGIVYQQRMCTSWDFLSGEKVRFLLLSISNVHFLELSISRYHESVQLRRPIEWTDPCDVATQHVNCRPERSAAESAGNKFGNVAQSSLEAPRSRAK
ncbi:hypothetical protein J6590_028115 [Homalodisca vitripennis]|nr:hypothetical protein J6590_028115 [Homalodisca vitripennis]